MKSFTTPRPNVYECSDGYSVEILGRTGIRYHEGNRSIFVDSEVLAPPAGILIYQDSIQSWQLPDGASSIDESERQRILRNMLEMLQHHDIRVDVM